MGSKSSSNICNTTCGFGGKYTKCLHYDPEAENFNNNKTYKIHDNELLTKTNELPEINDKINYIWVYKNDLFDFQIESILISHHFIVISCYKLDNQMFWSFEKNAEGVTVQRSIEISSVRDRYRGKIRKNVIQLVGGKGKETIKDFIKFIYTKNYLSTDYNLFSNNCQDFVKIFNFFNSCGKTI